MEGSSHQAEIDLTRGRILVLDDSEIVLEASRECLEGAGFSVETLSTPFALVRVARQFRPDIILLDLRMPAMQGDKVYDFFEQSTTLQKVLVLFYSDAPEGELKALVSRTGAAGYIRKRSGPYLVAEIEKWVDTKQTAKKSTSRDRILVVGPLQDSLPFGLTFFVRKSIDLETAETGAMALEKLRACKTSLLIGQHNVGDGSAEKLYQQIRDDEGIRRISIIHIASPGDNNAEKIIESGANTVLRPPFSTLAIEKTVGSLLSVAVRRNARFLLRVTVEDRDAVSRIGTSRNISASGMLVELVNPLDIGTLINVRFVLPKKNLPIVSRAEVVREHVRNPDMCAVGIRFVEMGRESEQAIADFVETADAI